ncbi:solute carrier family 23 protein, partial [Staphylococcus epidermidis]|uniref:solute carrier family 23 protein n=1 Tax=Staphylococcus epidermidis TaxID=1282 RepID=UPI0028CB337E
IMSGLMYVIIRIFIKLSATHSLIHFLPPLLLPPLIILIPLTLPPTPLNIPIFQNSPQIKPYNLTYLILPFITLPLTIIVQPFFKPFLSLIPLLIAIILPYILSIFIPILKFPPI